MSELFGIIIAGVLLNNFVLTKFLGLCPLFGATTRVEIAFAMSMSTTFVLTLSAALSYLINAYVLVPLDLEFLRLLVLILVIAAMVQFSERMIQSSDPLLAQSLGIYLPLITTNCAILGVALLNVQQSRNFVEALAYGIGAGLGFCLVMVLFAAIRERLELAEIPKPFRGAAIALITAGLMSLAFIGFSGIVKG